MQWDTHGRIPPLGYITKPYNAENFQAAFLSRVASKLDAISIEGHEVFVCAHQAVVFSLGIELERLVRESWIRIVLTQGPPLV